MRTRQVGIRIVGNGSSRLEEIHGQPLVLGDDNNSLLFASLLKVGARLAQNAAYGGVPTKIKYNTYTASNRAVTKVP
jgi:hypothetical protein